VIHDFLRMRILAAGEAGVRREQVIVDPGLGHFVSADPHYSFRILGSLGKFTDLGPVLVSPSRKSFLCGPRNLPPVDRLPATLAATVIAALNGAGFVRTHDVKETREVLDVLNRVMSS
jgi:dihydropteroate synthase type 2